MSEDAVAKIVPNTQPIQAEDKSIREGPYYTSDSSKKPTDASVPEFRDFIPARSSVQPGENKFLAGTATISAGINSVPEVPVRGSSSVAFAEASAPQVEPNPDVTVSAPIQEPAQAASTTFSMTPRTAPHAEAIVAPKPAGKSLSSSIRGWFHR